MLEGARVVGLHLRLRPPALQLDLGDARLPGHQAQTPWRVPVGRGALQLLPHGVLVGWGVGRRTPAPGAVRSPSKFSAV